MNIDHVAIACKDVERMRAWYEQALGFRVSARKLPSRPDAIQPTYLVGPPDGGATIELMPDDRGSPGTRRPFMPGIAHLAIRVDDLPGWEARLSEAGVRWLGEAVEATGGGIVRSFLDPEENMLQIVSR